MGAGKGEGDALPAMGFETRQIFAWLSGCSKRLMTVVRQGRWFPTREHGPSEVDASLIPRVSVPPLSISR